MRGRAGAAAFSLTMSLLAAVPSQAQSPDSSSPPPAAAPSPPAGSTAAAPPPPAPAAPLPAPGFMPPYEVTKVVRSAGFEPLAPPLREGTTYVLRATDFRGILMRVVVDAHSGAIRAVNRIVSGPEPYGPIGMAAPPYGMPPYGPPGGPEMMPDGDALAPPFVMHSPATRAPVNGPPLPRPRPAELASRDAQGSAKPGESPAVKPEAQPGGAAAAASPSPATLKRPPPPPPINE